MAKEFGYCSSGCTRPQFEKQIDNINSRYPNAILIKEIYSKTVSDRTELNKLLSQLEKDDVLVVNSVDRLSRNPEKVISYYKTLAEKGVKLIFINQPYMNTEIYISAYEDTVSKAPEADKALVFKSLLHLLTDQVNRILEKSWEDLQQHRVQMRESYNQAMAEKKQTGKAAGKRYESRKSFMVKELIKRYNQNYNGSMNDVATMEQIRNEMGTISRNTYYKYKKELAEEQAG
ncbi:MAG: recombinase family protein [Eubacterium sp.]|nr:recombinase family protein [Eubacterium sp.]